MLPTVEGRLAIRRVENGLGGWCGWRRLLWLLVRDVARRSSGGVEWCSGSQSAVGMEWGESGAATRPAMRQPSGIPTAGCRRLQSISTCCADLFPHNNGAVGCSNELVQTVKAAGVRGPRKTPRGNTCTYMSDSCCYHPASPNMTSLRGKASHSIFPRPGFVCRIINQVTVVVGGSR